MKFLQKNLLWTLVTLDLAIGCTVCKIDEHNATWLEQMHGPETDSKHVLKSSSTRRTQRLGSSDRQTQIFRTWKSRCSGTRVTAASSCCSFSGHEVFAEESAQDACHFGPWDWTWNWWRAARRYLREIRSLRCPPLPRTSITTLNLGVDHGRL